VRWVTRSVNPLVYVPAVDLDASARSAFLVVVFSKLLYSSFVGT
jgi:hypothetical protein